MRSFASSEFEDPPATLDPAALYANLTPAQHAAVTHVDGPLLILAGPGSGKTRVVTRRVAHLLAQGVPAGQILALTFTNKAADEMRQRVRQLAPGQPVWIGTFHRFCARLLRRHANLVGLQENFSIYDTEDSLKALKAAMRASPVEVVNYSADQIARAISAAKSECLTADQYQARRGSALGALVEAIYPLYQRELLVSNAVDFDDLLTHCVTMLRENPELRAALDARYQYILVDEYQDTNRAQYYIARGLAIDHPNLAVTGDPDQSIYGWRGANINNILDFEHDYPQVKVVRLEQNYRSTKAILRVADALIRHNTQRKAKELFTENDEGEPPRLTTYDNERHEAAGVAAHIAGETRAGRRRPGDFAVFYRANALSRAFEHALRAQGVPYQIVNGVEFYQRKEIKDLVAYLRLLNNPRDNSAFERVVNTPARGIGKQTLAKLGRFAADHGLPLLEAARRAADIPGVAKRSAAPLLEFVRLQDGLARVAHAPVEEVLGHVLTASQYKKSLEGSADEEDQQRLANIEELLSAAREFDGGHPGEGHLEEFLEQASLVNDSDALESGNDRVTLMTLHAAKGLEFPVVFIVAVEQNILPHERSLEDPARLEEERRLLFVGLTRAQQELHVSLARRRNYRGRDWPTIPSPFLLELPRDEMDTRSLDAPERWASDDDADDRQEEFGDDGAFGDDDAGDRAGRRGAQRADQDDADDASFDPAALEGPPTTPAGPAAPPGGLRTAAEMLAEARRAEQAASPTTAAAGPASAAPAPGGEAAQVKPPRVAPEVFQQGMLVNHPEYGVGVIVALGGAEAKRRATVRFFTRGEKKFILAHSDLRPVRSPGE